MKAHRYYSSLCKERAEYRCRYDEPPNLPQTNPNIMNRTLIPIYGVFLAGAICTWSVNVKAQEAVTETHTTSVTNAGTITQFTPGGEIIVRGETGVAPVPYVVTKKTVYVDEAGNPVSVERISSGAPVTVNYVREGDRMIASRVVVRGPAVEERRTTTTVEPTPAPPVVEERRTTTVTPAPVAPPVVQDRTTTTTTTTETPGVVRKLSHQEKEALKEERKAQEHEDKAQRHLEKADRGE